MFREIVERKTGKQVLNFGNSGTEPKTQLIRYLKYNKDYNFDEYDYPQFDLLCKYRLPILTDFPKLIIFPFTVVVTPLNPVSMFTLKLGVCPLICPVPPNFNLDPSEPTLALSTLVVPSPKFNDLS